MGNDLDRLADMAVFVRVVEAGSFTAAATALGLTKSAVSKRVGRLEDGLGVRLLNRTTRRFDLTDAGAALFDRARAMVDSAEEAQNAATELQAEPKGRLRVSLPHTFGLRHLGPILPEFLSRHPGLSLELTQADRMVDLVAEGLDVAVRIAARLTDESLVARRICGVRRVVCAAPDYLARRGTPRTPAELATHEGLLYSHHLTGQDWVLRGPSGPVTVTMRGRFTADNGDLVRQAAVAGLGIAIQPTFIVGDDLKAGRLVRVLPDHEQEAASVWIVRPPARNVPAKVRAFVDFLVERFGGPVPPWESGVP